MTAPTSRSSASGTTAPTTARDGADPLARYERGPFHFRDQDYYDRHLVFDHAVTVEDASPRRDFTQTSNTVRLERFPEIRADACPSAVLALDPSSLYRTGSCGIERIRQLQSGVSPSPSGNA